MNRRVVKGIITGGALGTTIAMFALGKKIHRRRTMRKKRILNRVATVMKGLNIFDIYLSWKHESEIFE
jgi:sulfite exporter TauE/SafE